MGNHAQHIRESYPSRAVTRRGRNYIEFDTGGGQRTYVTTIDPLHLRGSETEVDTAWVADTGAWQWRIASTDYQAHARSVFNAGGLYEWRKGEHWIVVDPQSINWINQDLSRQQIAIKQAVTGVPTDETMRFTNAYGAGRHFEYVAHPKRLIKHIIIDNASDLPAPTVTGDIKFEAEFTISTSTGLDLYLDGVKWAKTNGVRVRTANQIDFRDASNTPLWYADAPYAEDANGVRVAAEYEVRRQGGSYFITVRVPREWLLTAAYPVKIDPTFTDGYGGDVETAKDAMLETYSKDQNFSTATLMKIYFPQSARHTGIVQFDMSSLAGKTILSSTFTGYGHAGYAGNGNSNIQLYRVADGNDWIESELTWNNRKAGTPWIGGAGGFLVAGTDYDATSSIGTAVVCDWTQSYIQYDFVLDSNGIADVQYMADYVNNGFILWWSGGSAGTYFSFASSDHATTDYRPKLVVTYTEGAGSDPEGSLIGGKLIRGGLLTHGVLVRG